MPPIRIRYLMWLPEKLGVEEEEIALDKECISIEELAAMLAARHRYLEGRIDPRPSPDKKIILLVNGRPAAPGTRICGGDTVTVTPVVSGG